MAIKIDNPNKKTISGFEDMAVGDTCYGFNSATGSRGYFLRITTGVVFLNNPKTTWSVVSPTIEDARFVDLILKEA